MKRYNCNKLKGFCVKVAMLVGMEQSDAELFADTLICAQMRGLHSHGLYRLRHYTMRMKKGLCENHAELTILNDSPSALRIDGNNGLGCLVAAKTMDLCIERARQQGVCFAAVCNSNHFGMGAYYTEQASEAGMMGIVMSNTIANTVIFGGREAILGTNPLGISLPLGNHSALNLDMATTEVAKGKVRLAQAAGQSVPEGWGTDKYGEATTDPNEIMDGGFMMPFGGAKGSAISLIIDILCTALSGATLSTESVDFWDNDLRQNIGFFIGAIDLKHFGNLSDYYSNTDKIIGRIQNCRPARGFDRVYYPGEIEQLKFEDALANGVEVSDVLIKDWTLLAQEYGIDCPFADG